MPVCGGLLKRSPRLALFVLLSLIGIAVAAVWGRQATPTTATSTKQWPVMLPTSKMLSGPARGKVGDTNSFPGTLALSPDGHYAAMLNFGYGTQESRAHQSIAILDLKTNRIVDYPDARLSDEAHQSYFVGLTFSSDGHHLYASMGSLTDPTGATPGN